jgi:hypothetical protein
LRLCFPADIERNAQISLLRPDFLDGHDAGEAGLVFEILIAKGSVLDIVYSPPSFLRRYKRWFR